MHMNDFRQERRFGRPGEDRGARQRVAGGRHGHRDPRMEHPRHQEEWQASSDDQAERPHGRHHGRGGHHGCGGSGDRGWGHRGGPKVGRGDVRAAILSLLNEQPLHGYEMIQQIAMRSGNVWRPSPGSVYPSLQLLEDQGLIQGKETEGRRVYHLTDAGRTYVERQHGEIAAAWAGVTGTVNEAAVELHNLLDQVGSAMRQVAEAGTAAQIAAARTLLITTRRQLYQILADDEAT
jgi:DNA-binding PadR family transcriptional regulator